MADQKITELTDYTPPIDTDVLPIVDITTSTTKKIQVSRFDSRWAYKAGLSGGQTIIGGTEITDILRLQGTTGNGTLTSPAIQFLVGDNGGTIALTVLNNGRVGIGAVAPLGKFHITGVNTLTGPTICLRQNNSEVYGFDFDLETASVGRLDIYGVTNSARSHRITILRDLLNVGIGTLAPTARLHIDQSYSTGAIPCLTLDQADVSEEFIRFIGTSANAVKTQSIVEAADATPTLAGFLKVYVQDDGNQLTDQAYYLSIYTLA